MADGFSHMDSDGNARMVDVSAKAETRRVAVASARLNMAPETLNEIVEQGVPKGDVLAELEIVSGKHTHCPIKGEASYLSLDDEVIGWSYETTIEGAEALKGRVAFYASQVSITEHPA